LPDEPEVRDERGEERPARMSPRPGAGEHTPGKDKAF
jgi:hypothetical protein